MVAEDEIPTWGLRLFGPKKDPPQWDFTGLGNCKLLEASVDSAINSMLELDSEEGDNFLERLLMNGWLSNWVFTCGHVEDSIALWAFYQMLYSTNEELQISACDFWCSVLRNDTEVDASIIRLDWHPKYAELRDALNIYGYLMDSSANYSSHSTAVHEDSQIDGPPQNIKSWIKFLTACFRARYARQIFSISEVEEALGGIIFFFVDRHLQGLSYFISECMLSALSFFTDDEWNISCENIANCLANRIPKNMNCVRVLECISVVNARSKNLRSKVALRILLNCFDMKVSSMKDILIFLLAINVKDKNCDFFNMYRNLVLIDNWLLSDPPLDEKPTILELWNKFLRNCSSQITSTDWRSYASKVRNKASYLLQNQRKDPQ
ncbi:hypothetical protein QJS04_geneDACA002214 [Acorus gramineus]|uniref:Uncharacterized protein n=1 Tax=Acorus gramineus TaxID=55184 RepID=A0AAV9A9Y9_ACOGR|nr:hypothetical protein QJS04_geneDACA002214 [Acorus gramineus]